MSTSMSNTSFGQTPSDQTQSHEPALIRRPLDHCPKCRSWQLRPIVARDVEEVHFLCGSCSRCWHVELGFVRRVPPTACNGCPQAEHCAAVYDADLALTDPV
ncbi:MAG TPA: hypothetical protein VGP92_15020 [Acidimicrobiia bacterium]|nr:hypothetical protein [Acidimicrobiia bacterium]